VWVGEDVGISVAVADGVRVPLGVLVAVAVTSIVGNGVPVLVECAVSVAVAVAVGVDVPVVVVSVFVPVATAAVVGMEVFAGIAVEVSFGSAGAVVAVGSSVGTSLTKGCLVGTGSSVAVDRSVGLVSMVAVAVGSAVRTAWPGGDAVRDGVTVAAGLVVLDGTGDSAVLRTTGVTVLLAPCSERPGVLEARGVAAWVSVGVRTVGAAASCVADALGLEGTVARVVGTMPLTGGTVAVKPE
jgi:hypothetical protein